MQIYLSTLTENDYETSLEAVEEAFKDVEMSNHDEQQLINKIRKSEDYNYELEVVAKNDEGSVIGHALLSEVIIEDEQDQHTALALAPVSVLPEYRNQGLGKALIQAVEERAKNHDYDTIVVLGDPEYYQPLGYANASNYKIHSPFDIPKAYFMVKFLTDDNRPSGEVNYPSAFN
ncbi:GNAT family N-acetyltransferase [Staphylococcus durrellii]|uniref:GNAT family N-acetyltransferase n=1 Tax=Staphylococcus durrellii TaxID=2781773 RepID=UPI00189E7733|nr:N-acetyltransferase [Staphylococcus durrellii]MBF7017928.1 N-acetyltransferase [Staphylococcus durrellii]